MKSIKEIKENYLIEVWIVDDKQEAQRIKNKILVYYRKRFSMEAAAILIKSDTYEDNIYTIEFNIPETDASELQIIRELARNVMFYEK